MSAISTLTNFKETLQNSLIRFHAFRCLSNIFWYNILRDLGTLFHRVTANFRINVKYLRCLENILRGLLKEA